MNFKNQKILIKILGINMYSCICVKCGEYFESEDRLAYLCLNCSTNVRTDRKKGMVHSRTNDDGGG